MAAPAPAPASAPNPAPVTDLTWRELLARAEAGDVATVEHFVVEHDEPRTTEILMFHAARGGQTALVRLLLTKHRASELNAMDGAIHGTPVDAVDGPHFDIVRLLLEQQPDEDPAYYPWRMSDGFVDAVTKGNKALVALFLANVHRPVFFAGFNAAVRGDDLDMVRFLATVGEDRVDLSAGLQASSPATSTDTLRYLIEKGATNWPAHVYARLRRKPNLVKHFYKLGIPLALLTGGHAPIQAIVDAHLRWNAHVRETLDELGVYKVLGELIVQY